MERFASRALGNEPLEARITGELHALSDLIDEVDQRVELVQPQVDGVSRRVARLGVREDGWKRTCWR